MDYLGFSFWELSNLWQKQLLKKLAVIDITHVQFLVLKAVYELEVNHEEKTQVKIAKQASIDVMMTSKVIRTLITKNLLERNKHNIDKRAFTITITKQGRKTLRKGIDVINTFEIKFFKTVGSQKKLKKELKKIVKRAKKQ